MLRLEDYRSMIEDGEIPELNAADIFGEGTDTEPETEEHDDQDQDDQDQDQEEDDDVFVNLDSFDDNGVYVPSSA